MNKGFTLIEIIIVIILIGIISLVGNNILLPIFNGYMETKTKDMLFYEAKFITERISREIKNAIPNTFSDENGSCNFANSNYIGFAIAKDIKFYTKNSDDNITIDEGSMATNDNITIYITNCNQFFDNSRVYNIIDNSSSYKTDKPINPDSPYNRLYLIDEYRIFRQIGNKIYLCRNSLSDCYLLGNFVSNISFTYTPGNTWNSGRVDINLTLEKSGIRFNYSQSVHVRNVP